MFDVVADCNDVVFNVVVDNVVVVVAVVVSVVGFYFF